MPVPHSLYWRPPADQKSLRTQGMSLYIIVNEMKACVRNKLCVHIQVNKMKFQRNRYLG